MLSMRGLARDLGYSGRHVVAMFRDQVGMPPKLLARVVRFHRQVEAVRGGRRGAWSDLALDLGSLDQAHLVREVRHFAGVTPTQVGGMVTDLSGLVDEITFSQAAPPAS